jgi:ribosome-associated protein
MLDALVDAVVDLVKRTFSVKPRIEGRPSDGWMLADYGDLVIHFFSPEQRDYYRLEELWSDGKVLLHVQ